MKSEVWVGVRIISSALFCLDLQATTTSLAKASFSTLHVGTRPTSFWFAARPALLYVAWPRLVGHILMHPDRYAFCAG